MLLEPQKGQGIDLREDLRSEEKAMKKTKLLIITIALLLAAPAFASYYSTPWGPMFTSMNECREAAAMPDMSVMDRNRDGRISAHEFERSGAADTTVSLFSSIDRNKDGYISKQELDAYRMAGKCRDMTR